MRSRGRTCTRLHFYPIKFKSLAKFFPQYSWSNRAQINRSDPFGTLSPASVPNAVGALLGASSTAGLPVNYRTGSCFGSVICLNICSSRTIPQPSTRKVEEWAAFARLRGILLRFGYGPPDTSTLTWDASVALFAGGLMGSRPDDSFGVGFFYNGVSNDVKNSITRLTQGTSSATDEQGVELFYDFAITPAARLNFSYQHIWNPLIAKVTQNQNHANVVLARLSIAY